MISKGDFGRSAEYVWWANRLPIGMDENHTVQLFRPREVKCCRCTNQAAFTFLYRMPFAQSERPLLGGILCD